MAARGICKSAGLLALALLLCLAVSALTQAGTDAPLPRPKLLQPNVQFWVDVFTRYSERDFIIHDRDNVNRIYQVLHLPGYGAPGQEDVESINEYLKTKYTQILNRLATTQKPVDFEEVAVAGLFKGQAHPDYLAAAQNLRVQQGMSEQFRASLVRARFYLPGIQRVFRSFGLPEELALLPTVESGFRPYARSKAGAVGLWQFTSATARQYMSVGRWHDERLDPTLATEAAARLLEHNHDMLGDWPLAITAYDYGTMGMMQAVEATNGGTLPDILKSYNGPHFGFASKNYYAELLAAVQVWENREKYFPGIDLEPPEDEMPPPPPVRHASVLYLHHPAVHTVAYRASHHRIVMARSRAQVAKSRPHRAATHHRHYVKKLREA